MESLYYIYALTDPRDGLPFYIGKGKDKRDSSHLYECNFGQNRYKDNIIRKIQSLGLVVGVVRIYEDITNEDEAYNLEAHIIRSLGRRNIDLGGILTNICEDVRPPKNPGILAYQYDHTVRKFLHLDGNEFMGTRQEFHKTFNVGLPSISALVNGAIKSASGWYLEGTRSVEIHPVLKGAILLFINSTTLMGKRSLELNTTSESMQTLPPQQSLIY